MLIISKIFGYIFSIQTIFIHTNLNKFKQFQMETKMIIKKKSQILNEKQSEEIQNNVKLNFVKKSDLTSNCILHKKDVLEDLNKDPNFEIMSLIHLNFDFVKEMKPREKIWDPNPQDVQNAFERLKQMWNKDQKSRNFTKHLISAFLPYNSMNRLLNVPEKVETPIIKIDDNDLKTPFKCAILNCTITGIGNISKHVTEYNMKKMFIDGHIACEDIVEGQEKRTHYTSEECEELNSIKRKQPIEIQNYRIGVMSDTSDKYLQVESIIALLHFATEMMFISDELNFTIKKTMINRGQNGISKEKQLNKKQINQLVGRQTYGMDHKVDKKTFSALEKLKLELEKEGENRYAKY